MNPSMVWGEKRNIRTLLIKILINPRVGRGAFGSHTSRLLSSQNIDKKLYRIYFGLFKLNFVLRLIAFW
jgi:hypothetical protein